MTVLDTNFMIYLLRNKEAAEVADYYSNPKTTTTNLFELYYCAKRSVKRKSCREDRSARDGVEALGDIKRLVVGTTRDQQWNGSAR